MRHFMIGFACYLLQETEWRRQKEPSEQNFRPSRGREGHKKWFEIVHWVVMNVFEPFHPHIMMYWKLVLT